MDDEPTTPFEARLGGITPAAPSEQLRGRIAEQIDAGMPSVFRPLTIGLAALGAAACVGVGVGLWMHFPTSTPQPTHHDPRQVVERPDGTDNPDDPAPTPHAQGEADAPPGSLLAYNDALRRSPESVLAMVDRPTPASKRKPADQIDTPRPLDTPQFFHDPERPENETNALPAADPDTRLAGLGSGRGAA